MKTIQIKKSVFMSSAVFAAVLYLFLFSNSIPGHYELKIFLRKKLVRMEPSNNKYEKPHSIQNTLIYILGGSKDSLRKKFITASDLYHNGKSQKILMLSEPGITEYAPSVGRNLTNDEWVIKSLMSLGIKRKDIDIVSVESGFFGTFTEAESITAIAKRERYNNLILITAPYHTMRVWKSFSEFLKNTEVKLFLYGSSEDNNLREILVEYVKLLVYENILLNDNYIRKYK